MIAAREALQLNQHELAKKSSTTLRTVALLERFNYERVTEDEVCRIAAVLELPTDDIMPVELVGKPTMKSEFVSIQDVAPDRLLAAGDSVKSLAYTPTEDVSASKIADTRRRIDQVLCKYLHPKRKAVFTDWLLWDVARLSSGERPTLEVIAKKHRLSREVIRQKCVKSMRHLQRKLQAYPTPDDDKEIIELVLKAAAPHLSHYFSERDQRWHVAGWHPKSVLEEDKKVKPEETTV